jgi:hypothetical protein
MPMLMEIAGMTGKILKDAPIESLRAEVKMSEVYLAQVRRATRQIRKAKIQDAVRAVRVALMALAIGKFEEAANIAMNAAMTAAATFKKDPEMATRVFVTARGIAKNAVRRIKARSV